MKLRPSLFVSVHQKGMRFCWSEVILIAIVNLFVVVVSTPAQCKLVDVGRDSVFITFERTAAVKTESMEQLQDGVLLRLHNNSSCAIQIETAGGNIETYSIARGRKITAPELVKGTYDDDLLPDGALVRELQYRFNARGETSRSVGGDYFSSVLLPGSQTLLFEVPYGHLDFSYITKIEVSFGYVWETEHPGKVRYGSVDHIVNFYDAEIPKLVQQNLITRSKKGLKNKLPYPPAVWFAAIETKNKPDWEILPQEAKAGEVILSKRNELGILSNFAATPFELDGKRYASVEGFWQMMLYPEGPDDERAKDKTVTWKYTREQVAQMTAFEAKSAGTVAEENMKKLGIDWCTYQGKRFQYRSITPGEHYHLILAAMRAKLEQNPEVKRTLLATGDLILKPDHHGEENPPPEWKYYEVWMQLREELAADKRR